MAAEQILGPDDDQDRMPTIMEIMEFPLMPYKAGSIPFRTEIEALLSDFMESVFNTSYATSSFEQLMEMVDFDYRHVGPDERVRLTLLCSLANRITGAWQRLIEFGDWNITAALPVVPGEHWSVARNRQVPSLLAGSLSEGLPNTDPAYDVFSRTMYLSDGLWGDKITAALREVLDALNPFLNAGQHKRIYCQNRNIGRVHPVHGWCFWPDEVPLDYAYPEVLGDARQILEAICGAFESDRDSESVRARLLKFIVLGDDSRYWKGVQDNHADLMSHIEEYIPANLSELQLPDSEADVRAAVVKLIVSLTALERETAGKRPLDRRLIKPKHLEEGRALLDLYLHNSRIDPRKVRYAHCLAITTSIVVVMSKKSPKIYYPVQGKKGVRHQSVYQALARWVSARHSRSPEALSPAMQVRLCSVVSLALFVENEGGMGPPGALEQHAFVKQQRAEFFASLPKRMMSYSPSTIVKILRMYASDLRSSTPVDPLDISSIGYETETN